MKRTMSLIAVFALLVCMLMPEHALTGGTAEAFAAEGRSTIDEIAEQLADQDSDPFDYIAKPKDKKGLRFTELAEYCDLRDFDDEDRTGYVTPVKFQNPYGNCWAFAAIAAAEASILGDDEIRGDYVADTRKEGSEGKLQMDLSEKHLSYFSRTKLDEPGNPQNGEGMDPNDEEYSIDDIDAISTIYNLGGHAPTAANMFATGAGPVLESENEVFKYKGMDGVTQEEWIGGHDGHYDDAYYSDTDKWAIDQSLRFERSYSLAESFMLPSPAERIDVEGENEQEYKFSEEGVTAIKKQLLQKRGVQIGYLDDTFNVGRGETYGKYINDNWAQYTFTTEGPRHAVCIVGYDDRYPKENFRHPLKEDFIEDGYTEDDTVPPGDGAFLVKNSWGSGEEEFPNKGEGTWGLLQGQDRYPYQAIDGAKHTGYFWLSYYDQSIGTPESIDFGKSAAGEGETELIDQYDYFPASEYHAAHVSGEVKTANIFTAKKCEELRQVSCETTYPETSVRFDIYLLASKDISDPEDGILIDTIETEPYEYGGFHKVDLNKPFTVMKGQSYAVVVTQKVKEESGSESYAFSVRLDIIGDTVINEGESYAFIDGRWIDYSDSKLRKKLFSETDWNTRSYVYDNFPIKCYTVEKPDVVLEVGLSGYVSMPFYDEDEGKVVTPEGNLMAWITDSTGSTHYDVVPEWHLTEGGEDIIDLVDGRDPSRKTITCKKHGGTYLVVTAEGIGTVVYPLVVKFYSPQIRSIKTGKDSITITTGDELTEDLAGYELSYSPKGKNDWKYETFTPATNTIEVTGLKPGKYDIKLSRYAETAGRKYYSYPAERTTDAVGLTNTLKASGKKVSLGAAKVKKSNQSIARKKAIKVSGAKGKVTYEKKSGNKKITINKKTGKITVKKGLKKGTYKVKVNVSAAGKGYYLPAVKKVTVTIKVK